MEEGIKSLEESMEATKELLGMHESFRIKAIKLYREKLITAGTYSNLMLSLRDIYYTVKSLSLAQEREFNRDGGVFYQSIENCKKGMFLQREG